MNRSESQKLFEKSTHRIPGGVNSPVRAFGSVGGTPFITDHGEGAYIVDIDGNNYVDYVMSWGPLMLGHANPDVIAAVEAAAKKGMSFGAPSRTEYDLASLVHERMPWIEKLRLVSSGTEACMTAVRLARAATKRNKVVKFDGGYHGHSDHFLVKAGSGLATGNLPASSGVPRAITEATISIPYNDVAAVEECFASHGSDIAAVIVEPVAANMGVIPPRDGYLQLLRSLTEKHGALLIFDEVITGFRVAPGGAGELTGIRPDLVCLGKILGGGLPIGGVGGRTDVMDMLAPVGPVYQAGTLSGNPLSTAAGLATLKALGDPKIYEDLVEYAVSLTEGFKGAFKQNNVPVTINRAESLFTLFFTDSAVENFSQAQTADMERYGKFFHAMLDGGVFLPPSGYEAWFVSEMHGDKEAERTLRVARQFAESC